MSQSRSRGTASRSPLGEVRRRPAGAPRELTHEALLFAPPAEQLAFRTTADVQIEPDWLGQERALAALEMGLGVRHAGFNDYVSGLSGTYREKELATLLRRFTEGRPTPKDRVLVQSFQNPDRPRALYLPSGFALQPGPGGQIMFIPLSLSASVTFEQSYYGIDGDSASAAELFALVSALSGVALRHDIAVTGSVNQFGEMQPIGGVNEKVEGFFRVCREVGLTGRQGVMLPAQNVDHLVPSHDVVEAVRSGQFHIYPVGTLDEGLVILSGVKAGGVKEAGTVHYRATERLRALAEGLRRFTGQGRSESKGSTPD